MPRSLRLGFGIGANGWGTFSPVPGSRSRRVRAKVLHELAAIFSTEDMGTRRPTPAEGALRFHYLRKTEDGSA